MLQRDQVLQIILKSGLLTLNIALFIGFVSVTKSVCYIWIGKIYNYGQLLFLK